MELVNYMDVPDEIKEKVLKTIKTYIDPNAKLLFMTRHSNHPDDSHRFIRTVWKGRPKRVIVPYGKSRWWY